MSFLFKELDYRPTPMGVLSLRRRRELSLDIDVYEIKLDEEYLMSSLFTDAEIALADLGLAELDRDNLNVIVGGLGLGYTAKAALDNPKTGKLTVLDTLPEIIEWHRKGLLPLGEQLSSDPRCDLVHGDFFKAALSSVAAMNPVEPGIGHDAILLDVDHSPSNVLHPDHAQLYTENGLKQLARHLVPGGVFTLWSTQLPEPWFEANLAAVFDNVRADVITFKHPVMDREDINTVYVARTRA
ncbi:spermidine synthase [Thalassospira australica]|uniref:spermidine synthase n=1 Tax=Thalassospira australica TaxID=1528106 RepID=UPI00385145F5